MSLSDLAGAGPQRALVRALPEGNVDDSCGAECPGDPGGPHPAAGAFPGWVSGPYARTYIRG